MDGPRTSVGPSAGNRPAPQADARVKEPNTRTRLLEATIAAIVPGFLYFAAWMTLCGCAFLFFGFETGNRSLNEIEKSIGAAE